MDKFDFSNQIGSNRVALRARFTKAYLVFYQSVRIIINFQILFINMYNFNESPIIMCTMLAIS